MVYSSYSVKRITTILAAILLTVLAVIFPPYVYAANTPDLSVTASGITISPSNLKVGDTATFKVKVTNIGTAPAAQFRVQFTIGSTQVGNEIIPSLDKSKSCYSSVSVKITTEMLGYQSIKIEVDPKNEISELKENNNSAGKVFNVKGDKPDLLADPKNLKFSPAYVRAGDEVTIVTYIRNIGFVPAQNVKVVFSIGGIEVKNDTIPLANTAASGFYSFKCKIPEGLADEQKLAVAIDPENTIQEMSEDNNRAEVPITIVHDFIDLRVSESGIKFSVSNPKPGQKVFITATVWNSGNTDSGSFTGQIFAGDNMLVERTALIAKKNNNATSFSFSYTIPTDATENIKITVKADPEGLITEKDESNNIAEKTLVLKLPAASP